MATLTVNGRKVKVDDSFLSLPPDQQEATVNEIAASLGASSPAGGTATPPPSLKPGSKEYALWARDQAIAGNKLPQVSQAPPGPQFTGPNQDIGSKLYAAGGSFIEGVPVAGPTLIDWAKSGRSALYGTTKGQEDQQFAEAKAANPISSTIGNVAGAVAPLALLGTTALGGRLLGQTGSLGSQLGFGAGSGALLSGADTAARGGDVGQIATNAAIGGGLGLAFPAVGAMFSKGAQQGAQTAATTAAIKNAPAASDLKSAASSLFQQVDQAGVTVEPQAFGQFVVDLARKARADRINPKLDPKAFATFEELGSVMGEVLNGKPLTLSELHNLRQIAQRAAVSAEGRDAMFAGRIVDALDNFVVKPASTTTANGPASGNMLLDAISTWGRARRVSLVEDAIGRAQNAASGFENGLRVEFRKLLNNKATSKLFTSAERQEIERVVRGSAGANVMKLIGKFGFGSGNASNMLGGSIGSAFGASVGSALGPLGTLAGAAVAGGGASLARKASEKITEKAAERAAKVVATPGVPVLPPWSMPAGLLPPAALPVALTQKRKPLEITVRGGAN